MTSNVGLIAEGGGMRGAYTAGVLEVFLNHQLFFHYAIGVSAGANTLCSYLSQQPLRNKRLYTEWVTDKRFISWRNLFREGTYFGMNFLFNELPTLLDPFDFDTFKQTKTHFKVGVTNCLTGQCEYLMPAQVASLDEANKILQASSSLPLISKVVTLNGMPYLDGGISDSIPIHQAQKDGYPYNVVILTRNADYRKTYSKYMHHLAKHYLRHYPNLIQAIGNRYKVYNHTLETLNELKQKGQVFMIRPKRPLQVDRFEKDVDKLKSLYEQGYEEALACLPQLNEWLHQKGL